MTTELMPGVRTWLGDITDEGYREYSVAHLVRSDYTDGPANVMQTSGLPAPGQIWLFSGDIDVYAYCKRKMSVRIHEEKEGEKARIWKVTQFFTTKPETTCQDDTVEDPLLKPQKISGSFVKYTQEALRDRNGNWVKSSCHEEIRGREVEIDYNRPTVRIEQNVAALGLSTFAPMIDCVNDSSLWGLPARCIKLSNVTWEKQYYGQCHVYYTRVFDFDINYNTFDRRVPDVGSKFLHGHWDTTTGAWTLDNINGSPPVASNPTHFDAAKDKFGNLIPRAYLNGAGEPATSAAAIAYQTIEFYSQVNFLILGIPTSF